jgi:hypothetical protein
VNTAHNAVTIRAKLFLRQGAVQTIIALAAAGLWIGSADAPSAPSSTNETRPSSAKTGSGLSYFNDQIPEHPWSIHVLKVDLSRTDYELHTTLPAPHRFGLATLSEHIKTLPAELGQPVAAINGDFWRPNRRYEGDPIGLQIARGELVSAPDPERGCFWIETNGQPRLAVVVPQLKVIWPDGRATPLGLNEERPNNGAVLFSSVVGPRTDTRGGRELVLERVDTEDWLPLKPGHTYTARVQQVRDEGNTLLTSKLLVLSLGPQLLGSVPAVATNSLVKIVTDTAPGLRGVKTGLGGGPMLIRRGQIGALTEGQTRHPRTAIGWNDQFLFFVLVDGRQRSLSVGMTLAELAQYMVKLGCQEALNLDGGASSTIWVHGNVMNSPCAGRERPMANALVLVQKPKASPAISTPTTGAKP